MNENKEPLKPLCLSLAEAEQEIADSINNVVKKHKIPFWMIEPCVTNMARQVSELAAAERANAKATYEKQLEEYEKGGANDG